MNPNKLFKKNRWALRKLRRAFESDNDQIHTSIAAASMNRRKSR